MRIMAAPYRLAYLVSHPIQYQAPLLRYLARDPSIDLTVLFLSDFSAREYRDRGFGIAVKWDVSLLDGYRFEFLRAAGGRDRLSMLRPLTLGIAKRLAAGHFDALWVHGYAHLSLVRAIGAARQLGIKVLMRGESHLMSETRRPAARALKRRLLPRLFARIDAFLPIGSRNREYYRSYGVDDARMFSMPYAVDNHFFRARCAAARPHRDTLRAELGLERSRPVILFAAKLQERKRARDLLDAYALLSPDGRRAPRASLVIVGDGPERGPLQVRARALGWSSIAFAGFRNQTRMPMYYDLCDVFVLPSEAEPWGLVVNEAMNAGKPVIASGQVGAAADLVRDGETGFTFPARDIGALADRLRMIIANPDHAAAMGTRARERVASFDFDADRRGLLDALAFATGRAAPAPLATAAAQER
jgi:glycosyltransferase involved in cell wall biosynthesis